VIYRLSTYPRTHRVRRGACQAFEGGSSPLGGAIVKCLDRITFYQRKTSYLLFVDFSIALGWLPGWDL